MGDFRLAIASVRLVVPSAYRKDKVSRMALALTHQEAAILALLCQEFLCLTARQVPMKPPAVKMVVKSDRTPTFSGAE